MPPQRLQTPTNPATTPIKTHKKTKSHVVTVGIAVLLTWVYHSLKFHIIEEYRQMNIQDALKEFLATTTPTGQVSVLQPYLEIVIELYVRNYTQEQIANFFCQQNIMITRDAVGLFIRKNVAPKYSGLRSKVNSPLNMSKAKASEPEVKSNSPQQEPTMHRAQKKKFSIDLLGSTNNMDN